jgi:hypothetical protein
MRALLRTEYDNRQFNPVLNGLDIPVQGLASCNPGPGEGL